MKIYGVSSISISLMSSSVSSQRDDILSILRNVNSNKNFDKTEDEETLGMRIETKVYLIINPMILPHATYHVR